MAEEIRKTGRPVVNISIQADGGVTKAIQDGIAAVEDLKRQAEAQKREPCPLSGLIIGGYNGGSDWTSGLSANPVVGEAIDMHLSAGGRAVEVCGRGGYPTTAASYEIGMRLMDIGDFFNEDCTRRGGKGLSQVNPTPGNKAGGLTTMTEKNLGSFKTQGHRRILGILDCGDPVPGAGAWGINQAQGANDAYASTTLAMSGCHICLFTTGRGNPIGNACMTTIKITGNPQTATALEDMIDYSAAPMLYGELSLQESGRELYELLLRVANGEETKAEKLGRRLFKHMAVGDGQPHPLAGDEMLHHWKEPHLPHGVLVVRGLAGGDDPHLVAVVLQRLGKTPCADGGAVVRVVKLVDDQNDLHKRLNRLSLVWRRFRR